MQQRRSGPDRPTSPSGHARAGSTTDLATSGSHFPIAAILPREPPAGRLVQHAPCNWLGRPPLLLHPAAGGTPSSRILNTDYRIPSRGHIPECPHGWRSDDCRTAICLQLCEARRACPTENMRKCKAHRRIDKHGASCYDKDSHYARPDHQATASSSVLYGE